MKKLIPSNNNDNLERYIEKLPLYLDWTRKGRDMICHHAPALIIVHGPKKGRFKDANSLIATTNITNDAHARNFGTCYLGILTASIKSSKKLQRLLRVPGDRSAHMAIAIGYPSYQYNDAPTRPKPDVTWV